MTTCDLVSPSYCERKLGCAIETTRFCFQARVLGVLRALRISTVASVPREPVED